ncbi:hypothetical protein RXV86_08020 [Alisedimentitalea sp. MJ-SS2]|uniref:hypothetical protein n=1 Tax=Aliisedimentitalea sp. MJ-SS2 TaxID=3049795 RepID=UPI0029116768|nr:hypothetical protein [Alisedimentitalea sp. MJ-SS2]MDU8927328.1 hypothetical protein [Alisedimentitalea sp. MJ-SS2]
MERFFERFVSEDKGAVTVDWVVLCAGVVGLTAAVYSTLNDGTTNVADQTAGYVGALDPGGF